MADNLYTKIQTGTTVLEPSSAESTLYVTGGQGISVSAGSDTIIVKTDASAELSNSTTGNAATATAFQTAEAVGAANRGVYIGADGKPYAMSYELNTSVPANAKFTDTNTKMLQTKTSANAEYAVLGTAQTGTAAAGGVFTGNITINPAEGSVTALKFKGAIDGTVASAERLGTATVGSATRPVWLSEGMPVAGDALGTAAYHSADEFMSASVSVVSLSDDTPKAAFSTGSAGAGAKAARADHIHPVQSRLADVSVGAVNQPVYFSDGEAKACGVLGSAAYKDVSYFAAADSVGGSVNLSDLAAKANGTASAGTSEFAARADHVHPAQLNVQGSSASCTGNAVTATTAEHLGSATLGGARQPVYLSSGLPVTCEILGASAYHAENYYALKEHGKHVTTEDITSVLKTILNGLTGADVAGSVLMTDGAGNLSWKQAGSLVPDA